MPAPDSAAELARLTPSEVLDRLLPSVERVLPGTRAAVQRARVTYFHDGNPLFYPGYLQHLDAFPADLFSDRIQLAGDYLVGPTVEGAVRSGAHAAANLLKRLHSE
jgi:protoporphyrinogen oxidase